VSNGTSLDYVNPGDSARQDIPNDYLYRSGGAGREIVASIRGWRIRPLAIDEEVKMALLCPSEMPWNRGVRLETAIMPDRRQRRLRRRRENAVLTSWRA
jgi:hypothetical protein